MQARRAILCLGWMIAAGLAAGCADTNDNGQPDTIAPGVRKAVGRTVLSTTEQAGRLAEDTSTSGEVREKLRDDPVVKGSRINVDTKNDVVTLSGKVTTAAARSRAGRIAAAHPGVKGVNNRIEVGGSR